MSMIIFIGWIILVIGFSLPLSLFILLPSRPLPLTEPLPLHSLDSILLLIASNFIVFLVTFLLSRHLYKEGFSRKFIFLSVAVLPFLSLNVIVPFFLGGTQTVMADPGDIFIGGVMILTGSIMALRKSIDKRDEEAAAFLDSRNIVRGIGRRFGAMVVNSVFGLFLLVIIINLFNNELTGKAQIKIDRPELTGSTAMIITISWYALLLLFVVFPLWKTGTNLGKVIFRLRIIPFYEQDVAFYKLVIMYALSISSLLFFCTGFLKVSKDPINRRIIDKLTGLITTNIQIKKY